MHALRRIDEKGLIVCQKMNEIVSLTLTLIPTSLGGFTPFSPCPLPPPPLHSTHFTQSWSLCHLHVAPATFTQLLSFLYFAIFLRDHCDVAFNPTSTLDRSKLSLTVQSQCLVDRFLHSLNVLLTHFIWRLAIARI